MRRRWCVVLLRHKGEVPGQVEAWARKPPRLWPPSTSSWMGIQCNRIMVQKLG
jgi:hypothetical protein